MNVDKAPVYLLNAGMLIVVLTLLAIAFFGGCNQ